MTQWSSNPFGGFGVWRERWVVRSRTLPRWGLPILVLAALPGLAIALLSVLLLMTSLLALLLLALPVYRLLLWVGDVGAGGRRSAEAGPASPGSKPVQVRVVDP
ncbi:MAG: hypothetical protein ACK4PI_01675 [Tepidisphaerales bacterium]